MVVVGTRGGTVRVQDIPFPLWDHSPPLEDTRRKERQRQTRLAQTLRIFFSGTLPRRQALAPTPRLRSRTVKRYAALGADFVHASAYNFTDNSPAVDTPRFCFPPNGGSCRSVYLWSDVANKLLLRVYQTLLEPGERASLIRMTVGQNRDQCPRATEPVQDLIQR